MFICRQLQLHRNGLFMLVLLLLLLLVSINAAIADSTVTNQPSRYGAWTLNCNTESSDKTPVCVATQLVTKGNNAQQVVIGVTVGYEAQHALPHIIFRVSPGANTHKGAAVKIDQQAHVNIPISNCDAKICEVRSFIPNALLEQMQQGKLLQFAFFIKNQQITYPVSLDGFAQTYQILASNHSE
jgi:invasion protein IalB